MQFLLMYDIQDNAIRQKVCDICLDYGLDRQQYSIFAGVLSKRQARALSREIAHLIELGAYVIVIPIASTEWNNRVEIGAPLHA